jgi:uncharacterized protein YndB with AHSA1/START domain
MGIILDVVKIRSKHIGAFATLPLVLLALQPSERLVDSTQEIRREVQIAAPPERVWKEILVARNIRPDELPFSLVHLIGVPRPVEGINEQTAQGEIRYSRWERGVRFQGIVTERKEPESITWRYAFDQHSFPPGSMDEHVAIGGKYFDILDTTFNLHRLADNGTKLEIVAHYRVSTEINAYAVPLANILGNDFVNTLLGLYKGRSEANRS